MRMEHKAVCQPSAAGLEQPSPHPGQMHSAPIPDFLQNPGFTYRNWSSYKSFRLCQRGLRSLPKASDGPVAWNNGSDVLALLSSC